MRLENTDDIKVLALDLDDTLLRNDKSLASTTREMLLEWLSRGNHVIIATGRPPRSAGESLPQELWATPWACYNGAEIRLNGVVIYRDLLPAADALAIVRRFLADLPEAPIGLEIDDVLYLNRDWERPYHYEVADLEKVATRPVAKVLFFHDNVNHLDGLFDGLPKNAQVMVSEKYNLVQVMSRTADKLHAIQHLVDDWGLGMNNVMAFGDDINDVKMVRESAIGIAVDNAVPEVKAAANHITLSNDDGGVDVVLKKLLDRQSV